MSELDKLTQSTEQVYLRVNQKYKAIIDCDPNIEREDSAKGLLSLIEDIKQILKIVNRMSIEERTKCFNLTYNAVSYISDISALLRKSNYSFEAIKDLLDCVMAMQANIILQDVKYMEKRTKIYLDICHIYEENQYLEPAISLLNSAIQKYKELKTIHEMDPPIPIYVQTIISNNMSILRVMLFKYLIQSGSMNVNDWRKNVDIEFGDDISIKLLCLVECLRTQTRKQSNIFQKHHQSVLAKNFKEVMVQSGYDLAKPYLDIIQKYLNEQKIKIDRQIAFKNTQELTQQLINEQIKKKREAQQKNVKFNDFKKASNAFPFEYHTELIHYAYETKNSKVILPLLESALLRSECRRIQVPYINDVGIISSSTPHPNIPNGYEKIPVDLNEANLRMQLKKLRKKNEGKGGEDEKPVVPEVKQTKQTKKAGKDSKDKQVEQPKTVNKDLPSQWQLSQITHKFVFMIIKRTMSPQNAVYDLNIVMGDEEQGPVGYMDTRRIIVPYIQEDMSILESKVKQYKGIKQSTQMVPYIILKHSQASLQNEQQKRSILVDVKPLIGKNPIVPPSWGYNKIPIDLRQVPEQFLKSSTHDYVFLTYKNDDLFFNCSKHVKILNALNALENTLISAKVENVQDQKLLEVGITYSLQKLNGLFLVLQECLQGKLGHDYYSARCDFLTHLSFYIWVKYLRGPIVQFDYVNELRLNQQIIDYDYNYYKEVLNAVRPIFLNGFRVLHFIMVNNIKSDILLLSRISVELLKLLENQREYKEGIQSSKACLDRIRMYRDQYLTKGLKGSKNKLLPFCITNSNVKIKDTISKMQVKYRQQRNYIRKLRRIQQRKENQVELTDEQLQEEQNQFLHYQSKDEIDQTIEKVQTDHLQIISILAGVQLDVHNFLFRNTLKYSEILKVVERQSSNGIINGIKQSSMQGLAASLKNKLSLMASKNQQAQRKNLSNLQSTLIQADKLEAPKPGLHWLQKKTIEEFQKNPYGLALLMANFAAINSQSEDKKYFLKQALSNIQKCIHQQSQYCNLAVNNAISIFSTLWDDETSQETSSSTISPFQQFYDGTWPCSAQVPQQPILISKCSTSISMKMPPFKNLAVGKKKRKIKSMSIYGKISANGVDVSTNCNQLEGTGLKNKIYEVVKITNLQPNNVYCFAVAPTNQESQLQQIGKTSQDISTCNPLPIAMLAGYIAKISYQINEYQTAYNACKIVIEEVCQQSKYENLDAKTNYVYGYKLKENVLVSMSLIQIRSIVESLYIMALCQRRKLMQLKENGDDIIPIVFQEKQQKITNWLMLASLLNPCLSSPIISIPFLIHEDFIVLKALSLSLIPPKWMNSKLKGLGVKVMEKVLKWGLEKNQINLARRIVYKWAERKWIMLGKLIQVEEKKQIKKGAKDNKDQEVKLVDKYTRMLIEKSPGQLDLFEDSLAVIGDQYSDFTNSFIERAKEQIAYYTQFVDNSPEQLDGWTSRLNSRLDLVDYLKDPLNSIKKVQQSSPYYLQFNSKVLRKALQVSNVADRKTLLTKAQDLSIPNTNKAIALNKEIQHLILEAISNDIEWSPSSKNEVIRLQQKTGKNLSKQIKIYSDYEQKMQELTKIVSKMDSLVDKYEDFDYLNIWISQMYYLKASIQIMNSPNISVKNPIKSRFDKVRLMNLEDLLKKKKEVEILDKQSICYSPENLKLLNEILKLLSQSAYSSYCIENWIKLQNTFKLLFNLLTNYKMTPFYHEGDQIWQYFAFISLLGIQMLGKIKNEGFESFKKRYQTKQQRSELRLVANKLSEQLEEQRMVEIFEPKYYMPELDSNTTKNYWFSKQARIDLQVIASVVAYTVQTLRLEKKFHLVINLTRQFCNVTQHFHSLQFLPFMIESQHKLIDQVKDSIEKENLQLAQVVNEFTKKKASKMKGERQHKLTNEPLPYEIQYEQKRKKIQDSLELFSNHKNYLLAQISASQTIIDQIKRDTSKTVLKQRQQRKFMMQFGDDQEHMFKNYGDDTRLAKNRKNAVRDIIEQYEKIYRELKNNKTSKDPLAEIQNRNEVGNLQFASGSYQKAEQYWEDALATIFKTVRPIDNYLKILSDRKQLISNSIGQKQTLLSLNLLYKISKFGAFKKLYYQFNCTEFACKLTESLYRNNALHPQSLLGHSTYRLLKLSEKESLADEVTISLTQLMSSLEYFALRAIDMGASIKALPLLNLLQHLSIDVIKNVELSVKCKIIKMIALANCGLISESITYLTKVANEKDLPTLWIEPSDQMKKDKGSNWFFQDFGFDNSKHWNDPINKQAIEYLKKVAVRVDFAKEYGSESVILFNYARSLILVKIFSHEIYDNYENNEIRNLNIQEGQNIMRDSLKRMGILEEHFANLEDIESAKLQLKKNEMNEEAEKKVQQLKTAATSYLKANGIQQVLIPKYMSEQPSALKKVFRVEFMARIRFSIHQTCYLRRLSINSFHLLKNALTNIHRISYGCRKVQTGYDPEIGVAPQPAPVAGKKDEKKGKKQEVVEVVKQVIDWQKQKVLQTKAQQSTSRISINVFWYIKLTYEMAKLLFQQNRFTTCKNILQQLVQQCQVYNQHFFSLFSQAYILRCMLRLGNLQLDGLHELIQVAKSKEFEGQEFLNLVMDTGQIQNSNKSVSLFEKGRDVAGRLWSQIGMKSVLVGIDSENPFRVYSNKDELTAQQEEQIKRKTKKVEKKGGKDEKKPVKKDDPKKKKQEAKTEYKVEPLVKSEWWNLLEQEKRSFQNYTLKPHPNFYENNIYTGLPLQYIKCFIRLLEARIGNKEEIQMIDLETQIKKLIKIVATYPTNGYYYLLHLYFCLAELNKNTFISKLAALVSKNKAKKIVTPYGDFPLNSELIALPEYTQFIFDNRQYLDNASVYYKKIITMIKTNCLLVDGGFKIEEILWRAADNTFYLAQYCGRAQPKFYPLQNLAGIQNERQVDKNNYIGEAMNQIDLSIKAFASLTNLSLNYADLGTKPLQPTAKIDVDISNEISQIDKQFKSAYNKMLTDNLKPKQGISSLELITYLNKISRQSEIMTFSNLQLQNVLMRCHRILYSGHIGYRQKCLVNNVDYIAKKSLDDKLAEPNVVCIKSRKDGENEDFIYVLVGSVKQQKVYYGRVTINSNQLSKICEQLYNIRQKMISSSKKSEAVRNRDYVLYERELKVVLVELSQKFYPTLNEVPEAMKISLSLDNMLVLIRMLQGSGINVANKQISIFMRYLHELKYKIKAV